MSYSPPCLVHVEIETREMVDGAVKRSGNSLAEGIATTLCAAADVSVAHGPSLAPRTAVVAAASP